MDLEKTTKSAYPRNPVITLPAYRNKNGFLYRYLHRYGNIILMMDMNACEWQTAALLIFYDIQKSAMVTPPAS